MIAFTTIRHGNPDGSVTEILEGGEVKDLPKAVLDDLRAQGLVGDAPVASAEQEAENETLRAKVAELEALLAKANAKAPEAPQTPKPPASKE